MNVILPYLRPYRRSMAVALLLMLVELVVELWHPMLLAKVVNRGILEHNLHIVLLWGGLMIGISLVGFVCGIINTFYAADVSQGYAYDIRTAMFRKIQSLAFADYNRFTASTLLTRLTGDVNQIQFAVFLSLRVFLRSPLVIFGALILAVTVSAYLGLLLGAVTIVILAVLGWTMKKGFHLFHLVQERLDRTNGVLQENLAGVRLIRAFVRRGHEKKRFAGENQALAARSTAALRLSEMTIPSLLLIMNVTVLGLLWIGSGQIAGGKVNVGEVIAVVNYAGRITASLSIVSMIITSLSRARASSGRISDLMEAGGDASEGRIAADPGLTIERGDVSFEKVSFQYPDTYASVLNAVSFSVKAGETAVILGATGSGKSSLLQLIPRIYEPAGGIVRVDGVDIRSFDSGELRRLIGYVPQENLLFSGTVADNLRWGKDDASLEDIMEAARTAQIHDTIMRLPQQYDTVIGQKGSKLSGGQKQRLAIARAVLRKPKLLLLDDCTSALDARTEIKLLTALRDMSCTTLLVTQKISAAMQADTILLLEDGHLFPQGDHGFMLNHSSLYRKIVQSQQNEEVAAYVSVTGHHS